MENKISLIISREYLSRIRKKSFIVMTILGPLLFAALIIGPAWFATLDDRDVRTIAVIDSSRLFINNLPETDYLKFDYLENISVEELRENFSETHYYAALYISHIVTHTPSAVQLMSDRQPSLNIRMHIANAMEKEIERQKIKAYDIDNLDDILQSIKTSINIRTIIWKDDGKDMESHPALAMIIGYVSGFLIYFFIFIFGSQVMRGVIEEKSSRVIEIIISSVKPFQLMMGKIAGIGMVGLTQFLIWVVLTFILVSFAKEFIFTELQTPSSEQIVVEDIIPTGRESSGLLPESQPPGGEQLNDITHMFASLASINFGVMIGSFIFFFLGGYLLYGALFAAIASAVDNEADTQQFMLPVTIPLILSILIMMNTIQYPESSLAFWFSIIPLTSPVIMMVRIPFGVPYWEVALSVGLLIIAFLSVTWLAGKIYKTGILMYGKKANYRELWKWLTYSN